METPVSRSGDGLLVTSATPDLARRTADLIELTIVVFYDATLDDPSLLLPPSHVEPNDAGVDVPKGATGLGAELYRTPLLTPELETQMFRRLNAVRHAARKLQKKLSLRRPNAERVAELEGLLAQSMELRNQIVQANLRLAVSIARSLCTAQESIDELISDALPPLIRAVELFDFRKGLRFSTYGTWAVRNALLRSSRRNQRLRSRFADGLDVEILGQTCVATTNEQWRPKEEDVARLSTWIQQLDEREQLIVNQRFGLEPNSRPRKFREIAATMRLSTERVRQILTKALSRLKQIVSVDAEGISARS